VQAHPGLLGTGAYLRVLAKPTRLDGNTGTHLSSVVPGGLDEQAACVAVAGLGDGPAGMAGT